jgi:hypothetical protein
MEVLLGQRTSDEENQETSAVISKCRNTREKISPESAFLRLVNCASPASAFRHQAHSGTAGHVISPALPSMSISNAALVFDTPVDANSRLPIKHIKFFVPSLSNLRGLRLMEGGSTA